MRILCVVAHPDDEVLGCGATIAKHVEAGDQVLVFVLGDGVSSRLGYTKADMLRRRLQAHKAADKLGVELNMLDWSDQRIDARPFLDLVRDVEKAIDKFKPDVIYTHNPHDLNLDHELVARAVVTACRPGKTTAKRILAFEIPSSTECLPPACGRPFEPNVFVEVETRHMERKLTALMCYQDEVRPFPNGRSGVAVKALAQWRGVCAGVMEAESFMLIREVS